LEFASRSFKTSASLKAHFYMMQFRFAHYARQAKQQSIMITSRIINNLGIRDQCAED